MAATNARTERYQHLRKVCMDVNEVLIPQLPKPLFAQGAQKLGFLQGKALLVGDEREMPVLLDYCLHDLEDNGQSTVQKVLSRSPFPEGSEQQEMLKALSQSHFSLFRVISVEPGTGATVEDLLRGGTLFLHDIGLSTAGKPEMLLPARVICPEGIWMTTGAPLPAAEFSSMKQREDFLDALRELHKHVDVENPEVQGVLNAELVRLALGRGPDTKESEGDAYGVPEPLRRTGPRVGRNDPCPCGSGKKFKKCCGATHSG